MAYSRLASVEEKRNFRNAIFLIILSIAGILLLYFYIYMEEYTMDEL